MFASEMMWLFVGVTSVLGCLPSVCETLALRPSSKEEERNGSGEIEKDTMV